MQTKLSVCFGTEGSNGISCVLWWESKKGSLWKHNLEIVINILNVHTPWVNNSTSGDLPGWYSHMWKQRLCTRMIVATLFPPQKYGDKVKVHWWGLACIKSIKQWFKGFDLYGLPMEVCPLGTVKLQKPGECRSAPVYRYVSKVNECIFQRHIFPCIFL